MLMPPVRLATLVLLLLVISALLDFVVVVYRALDVSRPGARLDGFANALEMGRFFRKLHGPLGHSGACSFAGKKKTGDLVPPLLMEQPETGCCENH
jgi:hypothetical protein